MRSRNLSIVALPLAALAIAGCGGGGDDSTSAPVTTAATTTALTKEELISRGDAICAEVNAAIGGVVLNTEEGPSQVTQVADLYIGMVESLKDIGTPDDSAGYPEFIAAGEELAQAESDAKLADERGDSVALGEAETTATTALADFEGAASAYGFEECGQEPSAPTPASSDSTESSAAPEEPETEEAVEPEIEEPVEEEAAPETGGGAGATGGEAPAGGESSGGSSSGGVGPG